MLGKTSEYAYQSASQMLFYFCHSCVCHWDIELFRNLFDSHTLRFNSSYGCFRTLGMPFFSFFTLHHPLRYTLSLCQNFLKLILLLRNTLQWCAKSITVQYIKTANNLPFQKSAIILLPFQMESRLLK